MAVSDLFKKGESLFSTTLSTGISTGTGETITLESVSGLPTDTEITLTFDRVDANGAETPTKMERITGTISGSTLTSYTRGTDGSTEQAHSAGAVIEYVFNSQDLNDVVDGILVEHGQDGAHDNTKVALLAGAQTISGVKSFSATPKVDTIAEKTAATGVTVDGVLLKDDEVNTDAINAKTTNHITLTPGTSKLVKLAVLRQDDTADTYANNQIILTGWGFVTGTGAADGHSEAVSFGETFAAAPIVIVSGPGTLQGSDPTAISDLTGNGRRYTHTAEDITTTGFTAWVTDIELANVTNGLRVGYSWIAIGTLS